jgi:hypothetical protein
LVHESNYLWLEAGSNFGVMLDQGVQKDHQSTTSHLTTLLTNAGISWKAYFEGIIGTVCPLSAAGAYAPKFNPFVFFDDLTSNANATSVSCINHIRPYTELAADLTNNTVARYVFIKPDICNSMSISCPGVSDRVAQGDKWLSQEVPKILSSPAYQSGGAVIILWDQTADQSDLGLILLSPLAKQGYVNNVRYTHGSTLRTIQEILGVTPFLGDAANQTAFDDFFGTTAINQGAVKLNWSPSVGASTYNVKRSTTNSGPFITIATGIASTTYTDRTLTGGQQYFYEVTAVNGSGESTASVSVAATAPSVPLPPADLTVTPAP